MPLEAVSGAILASFLTPPEPRKSCSRLGAVLIFAKIAYGAREPKIDPKTNPKSSPKPPPEASKRLKLSIQGGASFLSKFQLKFERFWDPKMTPQFTQNLLWRHLGASCWPSGGLPEASRERFSSQLQNHIKYVDLRRPALKNIASEPPNHRQFHGFGTSEPPTPRFGSFSTLTM